MRKILIFLAIFGLAFAGEMFQSVSEENATLIMQGKEKNYCPNCGMNLIKFHKTNHVHKDKQYCSLHCLYEATNGVIPSDAKVMDTKNLGFIDAKTAFYVVGSKVKGTMSKNSKYAFANEADAKEFMAKNGGEIMDFRAAYAKAKEDFGEDKKMIKAKREGGVYKKGKELYEKNCQKTDKKEYENIALLKQNLKDLCKLQNDGDLQAVALYIWDEPKNLSEKKRAEKIKVPKDARCPVCGMIVAKHPQWVAMIENGKEKIYFDGVKDMMKFYFQNDKKFDKLFVSDYYKLHKIDAKTAFFVIGSNVYGPMGDELIPFKTEEEAQSFAGEHAGKKILSFDEIDEKLVKEL
ncbi:MAG: nitrous oxide reductase accessory protein NosL [Campylobacter sp.]|nr:nitrous oxide reductase accessory protein NosL [Campylobacter sp.]